MFELCFGAAWMLFMVLFSFPIIMNLGEMNLFIILFVGIFWAIGIFIFIQGLKKILINRKTEKYGEECYGQVKRIYPTGTRVNGNPELAAEFIIYIPSKNNTEIISETIGFNSNKYPVSSFVKCKHYQGDINIKEKIEYNAIPLNIRTSLDNFIETEPINAIKEDIITINGVKYKKIDE